MLWKVIHFHSANVILAACFTLRGHDTHIGCVFTTALVSLNIPEGVLFIDSVKLLKNDRCFHE